MLRSLNVREHHIQRRKVKRSIFPPRGSQCAIVFSLFIIRTHPNFVLDFIRFRFADNDFVIFPSVIRRTRPQCPSTTDSNITNQGVRRAVYFIQVFLARLCIRINGVVNGYFLTFGKTLVAGFQHCFGHRNRFKSAPGKRFSSNLRYTFRKHDALHIGASVESIFFDYLCIHKCNVGKIRTGFKRMPSHIFHMQFNRPEFFTFLEGIPAECLNML